MRLFKYNDEQGIRILNDYTIKASAAHEFNDPFELTPTIPESQFDEHRIRRAHLHPEHLQAEYQSVFRCGLVKNFEEFCQLYSRALPSFVDRSIQDRTQNVEKTRQDFAQDFSKHFRIFCASNIPDSILMWSHYANKHRGIVVEFDVSESIFADAALDFRILPIDYKDEKVPYISGLPGNESDHDELLLKVASRKAKAWCYEEEIRIIAPANGDGIYRIRPDRIRRIILGARASTDLEKDVRAALKKPDLSQVTFERAELSRDSFELNFTRLPQ